MAGGNLVRSHFPLAAPSTVSQHCVFTDTRIRLTFVSALGHT